MERYQNGKIYTIRSHSNPDLVYVGSTCMPLSKRLHGHRTDYKNRGGSKNDLSSFAVIECDDHFIELHEECPCENKEQLRRQEGVVIRSMKCVNKYVAGRTHAEHYEDNKEMIQTYQREWRAANKEMIQTYKREWYAANKERVAYVEKEEKERKKEEIAERRGQKVMCEVCNCEVTHGDIARHKRTKKHLANLTQK